MKSSKKLILRVMVLFEKMYSLDFIKKKNGIFDYFKLVIYRYINMYIHLKNTILFGFFNKIILYLLITLNLNFDLYY